MTVTLESQRVAGNVRAEMARRGVSQSRLGAALNFSQQALSRRVSGQVAFNVDELAKIARYLDISISTLIDGDRASA